MIPIHVPLAPDPWTPVPTRVLAVKREIRDTFTFRLAVADASAGFPFAPGQFNMLYVHGVGEVAISISGDPANQTRLTHTIRAVGSVTKVMDKLAAGAVLGVRGPYGTPWPMDALRGHDVIVMAGGLGLAPLRPAIYHLLANRGDYGRVIILYGARSPAELLYPDELARWRGRFDVRLEAIVDRAGRDWRGPVGVVTKLLDSVPVDADDAALVCGPEMMMRFAVRELAARGVPADHTWISMERSMKCGIGLCGHCQLGGTFVCKDGPVYRFDRIAPLLGVREL